MTRGEAEARSSRVKLKDREATPATASKKPRRTEIANKLRHGSSRWKAKAGGLAATVTPGSARGGESEDETQKEERAKHNRAMCEEIMEEYRKAAWRICSERFYQRNATLLVTLELRDMWLKMLEAEWPDDEEEESVEDWFSDMLPTGDPRPSQPRLSVRAYARERLELLPDDTDGGSSYALRASVSEAFLHDAVQGSDIDWEYRPLHPMQVEEAPAPEHDESEVTVEPKKSTSRRANTPERPKQKLKKEAKKQTPGKMKAAAASKSKPGQLQSKGKLRPGKGKADPRGSKSTKVGIEEAKKKLAESKVAETGAHRTPAEMRAEILRGEGDEFYGEYYDESSPGLTPPLQHVRESLRLPSESSMNVTITDDDKEGVKKEAEAEKLLWREPSQQASRDTDDSETLKSPSPNSPPNFYSTDETYDTGKHEHTHYSHKFLTHGVRGEKSSASSHSGVDLAQARITSLHAQDKLRLHSLHDVEHAKIIARRVRHPEHVSSEELIQILAPHETRRLKPWDSVHGHLGHTWELNMRSNPKPNAKK